MAAAGAENLRGSSLRGTRGGRASVIQRGGTASTAGIAERMAATAARRGRFVGHLRLVASQAGRAIVGRRGLVGAVTAVARAMLGDAV